MEPVLVAYIPVLHEGYHRLFERHPDAKELFLFSEDVLSSFEHLVKDIRRLDPQLVQQAIASWRRFRTVTILNAEEIGRLQKTRTPLIVSDDDMTTALVQKYFQDNPIEQDTIFLRWDKKKSVEPVEVAPDITMSEAEFDQQMMELASEEGRRARDWWRRIGAVAIKDGKILFQRHNVYVPSDQTANDEGDPRGNFKGGEHFESSLALHAEAGIVAQAAKEGVSLQGADIYTDTFPCPPCAKQLAFSGIKRVFYRNGYGVLDGERVLKSQGVEIVYVKPT